MSAKFDAFISYSHAADTALAGALQRALHRFAKPIYRLRAIRVFRDETTLALTPELWPDIQDALTNSEYFILMADPEAAGSEWVQKEVSCWLQLGRSKRLLIVWTGGELVWDQRHRDFNWTLTTALPRQLAGAFAGEPLYLDLRWAKREEQLTLAHREFARAVAQLSAPIRGFSLDEIFGEDVRQHRRNRQIVGTGIASLALMAAFAAWRWYLEVQARSAAQMRLAQTLYESGIVESEEHDRPVPALLLTAQASASAPDSDARRNVYRLRALYLALNEPQEVHQLGRPVKWAMMPTDDRWVTFAQLPWLDVWDATTWRRVRQIDVDPEQLPVTGVSPYVVSSRDRTFEVVAHEAVDLANTRGSGWNNFQRWAVDTGALIASEREISYRSYVGWVGTGLPSRNPVSLREVEVLRREKSTFAAALADLARQPIDTRKVSRVIPTSASDPPPPTDSSSSWWVDAVDMSGEFVLASYYARSVPWNGTWNGTTEAQPDEQGETAVWHWNGESYARRWTVKESWMPQFPRSAGFGQSDHHTVLWVLRADGALLVTDAATGKIVRPPITLTSTAWIHISDRPGGFALVDESGRVSLRNSYWDDGVQSMPSLHTELDFSAAVVVGDDVALTSTEYSPVSNVRREVVLWNLSNGRADWKWPPGDAAGEFRPDGALSLAVSPNGRRLAAVLRMGGRPELWVWDRDRTGSAAPLLRMQHRELRDFLSEKPCPTSGGLQFQGDTEIVWCEGREVTKYTTVPLSQGSMQVPAEPVWTVKRATITDVHPRVVDVGSRLQPTDTFLAFAADGRTFLTHDGQRSCLCLWPTDSDSQEASTLNIDAGHKEFADLASVVFRAARGWQMKDGNLMGQWRDGSTVIVSGTDVEFRTRRTRWSVRDPRATSSAANRRWGIAKQAVLAVSRSGQLVVTVSVDGLTGNEHYGNFVRLWETATGEPVSQWLWHESGVMAASFSDSGWLWTVTKQGRVRKWPADTTGLRSASWLDMMAEPVSGVRLSPGGNVLPMGEADVTDIRRRFRHDLEAAADRPDDLAQWFLRRLRAVE